MVEKLEHGSLLLGQLYERGSEPFTVVAVGPGFMRRLDEISHRFLMCLAAATSSERFAADVVGDAHDPSGDSRTTLESPGALPDRPERVVGDLRYQLEARGDSPNKARDAGVIARMNLVECGFITRRNGGNERAIQIVSGNRLQ